MSAASQVLKDDGMAVVVYPNKLNTTTIVALTEEDFAQIRALLESISDMRVVDVADKDFIDDGIMAVLDKFRERGRYSNWRERMAEIGVDPDEKRLV